MKLNLQAAIDGKLDEQLNLALCEWLGWTFHPPTTDPHTIEYKIQASACWIPPGANFWQITTLPNHITAPESLGLVHEVEKQLTDMQHGHFRNCLGEVVGDVALFSRKFTSATARQRVIAILQTVKPEIFE